MVKNLLNHLRLPVILVVLVLFGGLYLSSNTNNVFASNPKASKQTRFPTFFEGFVTRVQGNVVEVLNGNLTFDLSNAQINSGNETLNVSAISVGSVVRINYFQPSGKEQRKNIVITGGKSLVKSEDIDFVIVQKMASVELTGFLDDVNLEQNTFKVYNYLVFVNNETKGSENLALMKNFKKGVARASVKVVEGKLIATNLDAFELDGLIPEGSRYLGTINGYVSNVKGTMVELLGGAISLDLARLATDINISSLKDGYIYASSHSSELPVLKVEAVAGAVRYKNEIFFSGPFAKDQRQSVLIFSGCRILVNENTVFVESDEDDDGNAKVLGKGTSGLALLKNAGSPLALFATTSSNSFVATHVIVSSKALF